MKQNLTNCTAFIPKLCCCCSYLSHLVQPRGPKLIDDGRAPPAAPPRALPAPDPATKRSKSLVSQEHPSPIGDLCLTANATINAFGCIIVLNSDCSCSHAAALCKMVIVNSSAHAFVCNPFTHARQSALLFDNQSVTHLLMFHAMLVPAAGLQERGDAPRPAMSRPPLQSTQHAVNSSNSLSNSNSSDEQCEPVLVTFVNAHGEGTG
jgi:hypothetical protein